MLPCTPPAPLQPGDLLRVIVPSGTLREMESFHKGVEVWRSHGYRVEVPPNFDKRWGYLAGTDQERRSQLYDAWNDPDCRGILCARGGYGATRLLEDWQWPTVAPKWLIGFSDITGLLWSLGQQQISALHAPVLTTLGVEPAWSVARLFDWVQAGSLPPLKGIGWGGGRTRGILLPGNLTVATHLLHTPFQPSLDGVILALEDVSEAPYRIDRMLTYWRTCGIFKQVNGIALGRFSQCDAPPNVPSFPVEGVLRDRLADLGLPIVCDLPFGHDGSNACLPVGIPVYLDGDQGMLGLEP